jgi:hypothetical protein
MKEGCYLEFEFYEAWGGFYVHKDPDLQEFRAFRLLLLTPFDCHMTLYLDTWFTPPTVTEVKLATVLAQHVPIVAGSLANMVDLKLVGHEALTKQDLEGYATYLEFHDVQAEVIDSRLVSIMAISKEPPLLNRFSVSEPIP